MLCLYIPMMLKNCLSGNPQVTFIDKIHAYKFTEYIWSCLVSHCPDIGSRHCASTARPQVYPGKKWGMRQREEQEGRTQSYNSHRAILTKKNNLSFSYYSETWEAAILSGTQVNSKAETEKDKRSWWKLLLSFTWNFHLLKKLNILRWVE